MLSLFFGWRSLDSRTLPDDPVVANTLADLASVLHSRGQLGDAENLLNRALAINEKVLGPEHLAVG